MVAIVRSITVGFLMLGLVFGAAVGCGGESQKWYGKWEGNLNRADPSAPADVKNTINLVRVSILPNGTFEMLESGMRSSGKHHLGSTQAFLTKTSIEGQPVSQQSEAIQRANKDIVLTWQEDGTLLWNDPGGYDGSPTRLSRVAQPAK